MPITWDERALNDAVAKIEAYGSAPTKIAQVAAGKIASIVDEQFALQVDANGNPWAAHEPSTVERWGEHPILDLTGAMMGGAQVTANGSTIEVRVDDPAGYHQSGTRNMAARPIVPEGSDLPPAYEVALQQAAAGVTGDK